MFKSKYYPTIMYLGILITLLVLTFNIMDILEKTQIKSTGYAIKSVKPISTDLTKPIISNIKSIVNENFSKKNLPDYIYNLFILVLFISIAGLLIRFIYKIRI